MNGILGTPGTEPTPRGRVAESDSAAGFDLYDLHPVDAPEMSTRDKRAAWAIGTSGVVAGLTLGVGVAALALYVFATGPMVAWWALLSAFG
ncbi:hypothetical protein FM113_14415 [Leucobacter sp. 7(1)]|uniref:hypothetical protein n=1 Tax=Leucobacter sp. 7(1) TaxID=1255613 RepID=UPI00097ECBEF|nr:hypothetical protein [Leucobacter sp. 7(1)]SJN12271.1 hypothetical protein FM113_14415 [Leucobacter sp. 7(1)]